MIAALILLFSASAQDYRPFLRGPTYFAYAPLTLGHVRGTRPDDGQPRLPSATVAGMGTGGAFSLLRMFGNQDDGVYVHEYWGFDMNFGVRGGEMHRAHRHGWGHIRIDMGASVTYQSSDFDAWIRGGGFGGMDTADVGSSYSASEGGWRVAAGVRSGPLFFEVAPGIGGKENRDRSAMIRAFYGFSLTKAVGFEIDRVTSTQRPIEQVSTRVQLMIRVL